MDAELAEYIAHRNDVVFGFLYFTAGFIIAGIHGWIIRRRIRRADDAFHVAWMKEITEEMEAKQCGTG